MLSGLDPDRKNALVGAASQLNSLMDDNGRLLRANMGANQKLLDVIVGEVKKAREQDAGMYQRPGAKRSPKGAAAAEAASLSFNQLL